MQSIVQLKVFVVIAKMDDKKGLPAVVMVMERLDNERESKEAIRTINIIDGIFVIVSSREGKFGSGIEW